MSTQLDTDIEALVGELPDVACDSSGHDIQHVGGPATHYARVLCQGCGESHIKAYCDPFIAKVRTNAPMRCSECGDIRPALEDITILGPVNK